MSDQATRDLELAEFVSGFYSDPLGFVLAAYPWGEPGPLERYDGPDEWQREHLTAIGLEVAEREITREELGRSPEQLDARGQIVLAVIRKGSAHRFDTDAITRLESGDRLVVIRHNPAAE